MPEIIPFQALRYNPRVVPDLADVVTPPYDVISPEAQARYYARHPWNLIRLILAQDDPAAGPAGSRYVRAAETFAAWQREGILQRDPAPAVYLYEQEFSVGEARRLRRRGLLALVRLHEYTDGVICPHERTFSRYKDDRLRLMRACPGNQKEVYRMVQEEFRASGIEFAPGTSPFTYRRSSAPDQLSQGSRPRRPNRSIRISSRPVRLRRWL